jgi:hypothetical protein
MGWLLGGKDSSSLFIATTTTEAMLGLGLRKRRGGHHVRTTLAQEVPEARGAQSGDGNCPEAIGERLGRTGVNKASE